MAYYPPLVGLDHQAGKTIELRYRLPPPPDGSPVDPFSPIFLVGPNADDSIPLHYKSTDRNDTILIDGENWYHTTSIDGVGGHNVIDGTFGYNKDFVIPPPPIFAPTVKNIQWALLESLNPNVKLDFRNWSGLQYV